MLSNDALKRVGKGAPAKDAVAHAAAHVIATTSLDDGGAAVRAASVVDAIYAIRKQSIFHPIPQAPP